MMGPLFFCGRASLFCVLLAFLPKSTLIPPRCNPSLEFIQQIMRQRDFCMFIRRRLQKAHVEREREREREGVCLPLPVVPVGIRALAHCSIDLERYMLIYYLLRWSFLLLNGRKAETEYVIRNISFQPFGRNC